MIDGFSIVPFAKASHFPLYYFCFVNMRGGGGADLQIAVQCHPPPPNNFLQA